MNSWFVFEGHRVFYCREGAGEPIVFLPNATLTWRLWEHQVEHFRDTHDVIAVDLPGFGRSKMTGVDLSLDLYVRWLERFVAELDLAPVVLVGNCIGSLTALHYVARYPETVSALVLMNTLTREANGAGSNRAGTRFAQIRALYPLAKFFMRHMPRWQQKRFPYVRGQFGSRGGARSEEYLEHTRRCFAEPETRLAQLSLVPDIGNWVLPEASRFADHPPICWIWGESNRLLPLEAGKRQLEVLKPEESHILKGCGYAAAWEAPEEVNRIIETFLRRFASAPPSAQPASRVEARERR